jgi:hypothetical protein
MTEALSEHFRQVGSSRAGRPETGRASRQGTQEWLKAIGMT